MFGRRHRETQSPAGEVTNPFLPALRAWDDVNHFAVSRMHRAEAFAFIGFAFALIFAIGMVYYANQPRLIPYVVQTDKVDQQLAVARAERLTNMTQDPAVLRASLRAFIEHLRMVTFDPVFQRRAILEGVRPFIAPNSQAQTQIDAFYRANDPFARAKTNSVDVAVDSPVPMSQSTYQVEWTETTRNAQGGTQGTTHWRGFFTITQSTSGDEQTLMLNPAGMYVTNIEWSQVQ